MTDSTMPQKAKRHPALLNEEAKRASKLQLRVADGITSFAGSMAFVYIHIVIFAAWIIVGTVTGFDAFPFGFLTLIVSLEAIFLSTFVMIGQNRQSQFAQAKADHDFAEQETELHLNTDLTKDIQALTKAIHSHLGVNGAKPQPEAKPEPPEVGPKPKPAPAKKATKAVKKTTKKA